MTDGTDKAGERPRSQREADLARDLDALREALEAGPQISSPDVRRRIDAIADAFLDLHDGPLRRPPG